MMASTSNSMDMTKPIVVETNEESYQCFLQIRSLDIHKYHRHRQQLPGIHIRDTAKHPSPEILFEQCFEYIAQSECRAAIDTVVQGFLGMQDTHAPFAITRNQRSLDSSLRLPRRPCADASLDRRLSESEFHRRSFLYILLTKANIRLIFQSRISVMMIFRTNLSNSLCKPYS